MKLALQLALLLFCTSLFAQKNFIDQPMIATTATADTLVMPDEIHLRITLDESDSKGKKNVEDLEKTMEKSLQSLGIDTNKDLSLVTLDSDYQRYFFSGQKVNKAKMYNLIVHDAVTAGKVIGRLEQDEISNVSIHQKKYSKQDELFLTLKAKAVKKAQKTAQAMAMASGNKLGKTLFITDSQYGGDFTGDISAMALEEVVVSRRRNDAPREPIATEFQKLYFEASVKTSFAIE